MNIRDLVDPYVDEDESGCYWAVLPDARRVKFYVQASDGGYEWYNADGIVGWAETVEDACSDALANMVVQYWDGCFVSYAQAKASLRQLGYTIADSVGNHEGIAPDPCPRCGAERVVVVAYKRQRKCLLVVCEGCDLAEDG